MSYAFTTDGASNNRLVGSSGKLYTMNFDSQNTKTGTIKKGDWFRILKLGANTVFTGAEVGKVSRAVKDYVLTTGDEVLKFVPKEVGFVRDVQGDKTKEKFDTTTQADSIMNYAISNYIERSGTFTGVFAPNDPVVRAATAEFDDVLTIKVDGSFSVSKVTSKIFHFLLSRDEAGNPEVWEYLPVRLESLTAGKPQKDIQPFDLGYVTEGKEKPHAIYIEKA